MRALAPACCLLIGCGHLDVALPPRPAAAAPLDVAAAQLGEGQDRLDATAVFYDAQAAKAHTKARVMGVLAVSGAAISAGAIAALARPDFPDEGRAAVGAAGISMAAFSATFVLVPWAHDYRGKEAGYRRQASLARTRSAELAEGCDAASLAGADASRWASCLQRVSAALNEVQRFPDPSPCAPPPDDELAAMVRRARGGAP